MTALPVVEDLDIFPDDRSGFFPGSKPIVAETFILQRSPEALHWRVIVAVTFT